MSVLKIGDKLAIGNGTHSGIYTIRKETATLYIIATKGGNELFRVRKANLSIVAPSTFGPHYMRIPIEEDFVRARIRRARAVLANINVTDENIAVVEQAIALIKNTNPTS